jgi:hypothetical protein
VHQTEFRLNHDVVPSTTGIRASLAISGDGCIDETGIDLAKGVIVHAILLQGSGQVVLHEDVALGGEFVQNIHALPVLEGQANRFLIAVYLGE